VSFVECFDVAPHGVSDIDAVPRKRKERDVIAGLRGGNVRDVTVIGEAAALARRGPVR